MLPKTNTCKMPDNKCFTVTQGDNYCINNDSSCLDITTSTTMCKDPVCFDCKIQGNCQGTTVCVP